MRKGPVSANGRVNKFINDVSTVNMAVKSSTDPYMKPKSSDGVQDSGKQGYMHTQTFYVD